MFNKYEKIVIKLIFESIIKIFYWHFDAKFRLVGQCLDFFKERTFSIKTPRVTHAIWNKMKSAIVIYIRLARKTVHMLLALFSTEFFFNKWFNTTMKLQFKFQMESHSPRIPSPSPFKIAVSKKTRLKLTEADWFECFDTTANWTRKLSSLFYLFNNKKSFIFFKSCTVQSKKFIIFFIYTYYFDHILLKWV